MVSARDTAGVADPTRVIRRRGPERGSGRGRGGGGGGRSGGRCGSGGPADAPELGEEAIHFSPHRIRPGTA